MLMEGKNNWLRPKTTRRYIHPPKAERMFTLWAEGKLIFGHIDPNIDWRSYKRLECFGLWLVHGKEDAQFDFHQVKNIINPRGIPVHGVQHAAGGLDVALETFCNIDRKPTCFLKLSITNTTREQIQESFAWLLRSGKEKQLVFASPDEYDSYAPDVNVWKNVPVDWRCVKTAPLTVILNEDVFFLSKEAEQVCYDQEKGALRFDVNVEPGQSVQLQFAFGQGPAVDFDYEQEKQQVISFWERELSRLNKLPDKIRNDPEKLRVFENLTVHILQCFCYLVDKEYILPRQGGLQRLIWPWECMPVLEALTKIGDFADYVEAALSTFFDVMQAPSGEVRPMGEGWANITASALYSFASYALHGNKRFYHRYRDRAMAAFAWVKAKREESFLDSNCIPGLFPVMRGCDWDCEFQSWQTTDAFNIIGLRKLAEAAEQFDDPKAEEIRALVEDYWKVMRGISEKFIEQAGDSDELCLPMNPTGDDTELIKRGYPDLYYGMMASEGYVDLDDIPRLKKNWIARGNYCNELYGHMIYPDGNTHIWYTSLPEYYWFKSWLMYGDKEQAENILRSQFLYSMTDEYYMVERFAENDPYYVPWSPNASANGRTMLMMLELAKD